MSAVDEDWGSDGAARATNTSAVAMWLAYEVNNRNMSQLSSGERAIITIFHSSVAIWAA
jgi:hypothetical protein